MLAGRFPSKSIHRGILAASNESRHQWKNSYYLTYEGGQTSTSRGSVLLKVPSQHTCNFTDIKASYLSRFVQTAYTMKFDVCPRPVSPDTLSNFNHFSQALCPNRRAIPHSRSFQRPYKRQSSGQSTQRAYEMILLPQLHRGVARILL